MKFGKETYDEIYGRNNCHYQGVRLEFVNYGGRQWREGGNRISKNILSKYHFEVGTIWNLNARTSKLLFLKQKIILSIHGSYQPQNVELKSNQEGNVQITNVQQVNRYICEVV